MSNADYRFEIALSFAGDNKRDKIRNVAALLQEKVGKGKVFFYEWFESELAGQDAQVVLQNYYTKQTRLVVTCICKRYGEKPWTQDEWRAIQAFERDLRDAGTENFKRMRFLPLRFDDGNIDGLFSTAIAPDVRERSPADIAQLILERLALATGTKGPSHSGASATTQPPASEDDVAVLARIKNIHVDREEEKKLFHDMVTGQSVVRALLLEAESGMGKSNLIAEFRQTSAPLLSVLVDFKNASYTFSDVLFQIRSQLGQTHFQVFDEICRDTLQRDNAPRLSTLLPSQVDGVLLRAPSETRDQQMRQIFDALSCDLATLANSAGRPVAIIIDTFERASESLKQWIGRELIPRISASERVIWIFAGQEAPRVSLDGSNWLLKQRLKPLAQEHRREYLKQIKLEWDETLINYITKLSEGKPKKLQDLALVAVTST